MDKPPPGLHSSSACRPFLPAREMLGWDHAGGFSLDASVRIPAHERAGRERLLRYRARRPTAGH